MPPAVSECSQGSGRSIVAAQTCTGEGPANVRFGSKADISQYNRHVRFTPESGHFRIRAAQERCVMVCWKSASVLKTVDLAPGRGKSRQQRIAQRQTGRPSRLAWVPRTN